MRGQASGKNILHTRVPRKEAQVEKPEQKIIFRPIPQTHFEFEKVNDEYYLLRRFFKKDFLKDHPREYILAEDLKNLQEEKDPYSAFQSKVEGRGLTLPQIKIFKLMNKTGKKIIETVPYEELSRRKEVDACFYSFSEKPSPEKVQKENMLYIFPKQRTFWKPGFDSPLTRPYELLIPERYSDNKKEKLKQYLLKHPYLVQTIDNPHASQKYNQESYIIRLPQEKHDRLNSYLVDVEEEYLDDTNFEHLIFGELDYSGAFLEELREYKASDLLDTKKVL